MLLDQTIKSLIFANLTTLWHKVYSKEKSQVRIHKISSKFEKSKHCT